MRINYLVYKNGTLRPKYTIREKLTKITIATASDLIIALKIVGNDKKGLEIFNEATQEVFEY